MKRIFISPLLAIAVFSATPSFAQNKAEHYGKEFNASKDVMDVNGFIAAMKDKNTLKDINVKGTITQVCQAAGCWVKLKNNAGEDIFVKFVDGEISVPKDYSGKQVTIHGTATKKTISIDERRHFAEDAGASKDELAKIDAPKQELRINANGIVIQ